MKSFLEEVAIEITNKHSSLENMVLILPSKRAGVFIKNAIISLSTKTQFSPEIHSIETFIEQVSGLSYANNTEQLFELYTSYVKIYTSEPDDFYTFSKWGQTLLQDFNEIDRHLVDTKQLFNNLSAIQEIGIWSPNAPRTKMMDDYLSFWRNIEQFYNNFNANLLSKNIGHQGLVYRKATKNLNKYLKINSGKVYNFIGFNALNTAEEEIIKKILTIESSDIYWDINNQYITDPVHSAGQFIRSHTRTWEYYKTHEPKGISDVYSENQNIEIIGVPKNISQTKYVGKLLTDLHISTESDIRNTAVVLGDETLLNSLLNSIPEHIKDVNITMGYPLHKTAMASLFTQWIELYINLNEQGWFHQTLLDLLANPFLQIVLTEENRNLSNILTQHIKKHNRAYLNADSLLALSDNHPIISLLFSKNAKTPRQLASDCVQFILLLKEKKTLQNNHLSLEYSYRFYQLFVQLNELLKEHLFIKDIKSLLGLYKELLSSETLDFKGEPLSGLQVMGMLESRNLDFETVIITSVNEGILPSGKSNNSFIPFDLKKAFHLPTYKEKDAVYTYHFYRLLQRAKNIYILYNTESDVLEGGEKSRLIHQLLTDPKYDKRILEVIASPTLEPTIHFLDEIIKDSGLMSLIENHATNGFSPSSLSNYIRNPIEFYKRNLLGIEDLLEVEETVAHNTFGTIVHDSLEALYTPYIGKILTVDELKTIKTKIKVAVTNNFHKNFKEGDITQGKNLIAYHVVIRYIENFVDLEIKDIKNHEIKILGLEEKLKIELEIPGIPYPVFLKGKLDRIDSKDGIIRIIDYKTGKVSPKNVTLKDWDSLASDFNYSKAFQLLCYALMYSNTTTINAPLNAGIISFKNLQAGLLQFNAKNDSGLLITQEVLNRFLEELKKLILEICDYSTSFLEKEV